MNKVTVGARRMRKGKEESVKKGDRREFNEEGWIRRKNDACRGQKERRSKRERDRETS
jgi:hypothetical protein